MRPRREQETYSAQCTWRDAELWFLLLSDCSASQCQASVCVHCGRQSLLTQMLTLWVLQPAEPGSPGLQLTSLIFAGDTVRLCFGSPCCFTCFHREISRRFKKAGASAVVVQGLLTDMCSEAYFIPFSKVASPLLAKRKVPPST